MNKKETVKRNIYKEVKRKRKVPLKENFCSLYIWCINYSDDVVIFILIKFQNNINFNFIIIIYALFYFLNYFTLFRFTYIIKPIYI